MKTIAVIADLPLGLFQLFHITSLAISYMNKNIIANIIVEDIGLIESLT